MPEMKSLTLNGKTYDCFVDGVARSKLESAMVIGSETDETIVVNDATNYNLIGLRIFGKTTQAGTPTPDNPVELVSVGDSGSVTVNVSGKNEEQSMTIATPNGLPGIPVTSGGNYTDANGQQWLCDEIDFARGVYVSRHLKYTPKAVTGNIQRQTNYDGDGYYGWCIYDGNLRVCDNGRNNAPGLATKFLPANNTTPKAVNQFRMWANQSALYFTLDTDNTEVALETINSTEFLLAVATPIETPLTEEELAAYASLHTYRDSTTVSNDAGAYMELEYVMDAKKYIDSLVKASPAWLANVTLTASAWEGSNSLYSQVVTIPGITEYSKVDLLPSVEQLAIFFNKNVSFVTENEDGVVTVYAIGDKPTQNYTMQAQITEVEV